MVPIDLLGKKTGYRKETEVLLHLAPEKPQFLEFLIITLMPYVQRAQGVISWTPNDPGCGHTITKK